MMWTPLDNVRYAVKRLLTRMMPPLHVRNVKEIHMSLLRRIVSQWFSPIYIPGCVVDISGSIDTLFKATLILAAVSKLLVVE